MPKIDIDIAHKNLLLTQQYCEEQMNNLEKNFTSMFRSINPVYNKKNIFKFSLDKFELEEKSYYSFNTEWTIYPLGEVDIIAELFSEQQKIKEAQLNQTEYTPKYKGEILACHIEETLVDGAAELSSYGLLDSYNYPPIDTWFYLTSSNKGPLLLAWIPEPFTSFIDDGIFVNPENCIDWFKTWYPEDHRKFLNKEKLSFLDLIKGLPSWFKR